MSAHLESPEELAKGMAERSPAAALLSHADRLDRDQLSDPDQRRAPGCVPRSACRGTPCRGGREPEFGDQGSDSGGHCAVRLG
jgi:hypothetical protein